MNGAYHATPWGKHVNEGVPEWPPSSWRLLRAIIATWKNTKPELDDGKVLSVLKKLASELPNYELPDASVSHIRHYMPTNDKSALVISTFVVTGNKPVYIIWNDVILNSEEIILLEQILKNLHYFGRAESWCTASVSTDAPVRRPNCTPLESLELSSEQDLVRVLAPNKNFDFVDLSNSKSDDENLKSISVTVRALQDKNYMDPPGGRWVRYIRPQNCFEEETQSNTGTPTLEKDNITLIRYAIVGTVKPSIKDTLRIADLARSACMSLYGNSKNGENSPTFSGKDNKGSPLTDHVHAFYLPTYETQHKELDHLTIIASRKFDKDELDALFSLKRLYRHNTMDVALSFQGCGTRDDFPDIPILQKSNMWESATPLILTRHTKYRGKGIDKHIVDGPEEQIHNEIRNRYGDAYGLKSIQIDSSQTNIRSTGIKPFDFFRWRKHGSVGSSKAYNIKLEFKEPVKGPITVGYASHFGLGMFVPVEDE